MRMDLLLAEKRVMEWATACSDELGFRRSSIEAAYIWNPGGFVNQSYRISDSETVRHVKFAQAAKAPFLKQWATISEYLTAHYQAPSLVQEVNQEILRGYPYGLVFEFIEGKPLSLFANPQSVIQNVLKKLNQLHTDKEIPKLIATEQACSYSDAFTEAYITRFEEDLDIIRSEKHQLNFVTDKSLAWFSTEVDALRKTVNQMPSFQKQATDIVHNDINWQNILVNDHDDFWLIDWDDLTVNGDAAMDYSVFLWPLYQTKDWAFWKEYVSQLAGQEVVERMEFYFRAKLLDDVIDVLADYIEAENVPEVKEKTQKRAMEIHLHAYAEYMKRYV
ncbi:phosphotransferase [Paenibacillus alba]|uniref:Phosphotransferase n=1 Tax=Paenibacillus alba TaxID=1197127 RepID=A0ABU6G8W8_9BACL|nr:phosphotransferase [Paenibacillus alba]MEC0230614.1 phosphotransferase [Paenibacillus alba]